MNLTRTETAKLGKVFILHSLLPELQNDEITALKTEA